MPVDHPCQSEPQSGTTSTDEYVPDSDFHIIDNKNALSLVSSGLGDLVNSLSDSSSMVR